MKSVIELCYQAARTLRCQDWKNLLTVGRCSLRISIFIVIVMVMVIIIIHLSFQLMKLTMLTGRWSSAEPLGMSALNSDPLKNIIAIFGTSAMPGTTRPLQGIIIMVIICNYLSDINYR